MLVNKIKNMYTHSKSYVKEMFNSLKDNNQGIGVVEVILILVVLIGLVVIFRDQLTTIINNIFDRIITDSNAI